MTQSLAYCFCFSSPFHSISNSRPPFQDLAKLMASTDRYGKQISSQSEFLTSCRGKLNASFAELNGLLAEVRVQGLESKLRLFIANKEFEMEVSFAKIAQEHCNKLIGLFKAETYQAREALSLSCGIAQDQFLLLRANNVDGDTQLAEQQDALLAMLDNKAGVRFNDDNLQDTVSQLMSLSEEADGVDTPQSAHRASYKVGEVLSAMAASRKRRNLFDGPEGATTQGATTQASSNKVRIVATSNGVMDETVVLPLGLRNNNGSPVMEGVEMLPGDDALNGTFQMPAKGSGGLNETVSIVAKSVLKEQSLNKIMNQPALVTKMVKTAKGGGGGGVGGGRVGDSGNRLVVKKMVAGAAGAEGGGRSSPHRVAKARLAASKAGVAALKSKGVVGGGSAHKKWK